MTAPQDPPLHVGGKHAGRGDDNGHPLLIFDSSKLSHQLGSASEQYRLKPWLLNASKPIPSLKPIIGSVAL
ncbi:hypothetical protein Tco_1053339 [Tanacetum coccineum]